MTRLHALASRLGRRLTAPTLGSWRLDWGVGLLGAVLVAVVAWVVVPQLARATWSFYAGWLLPAVLEYVADHWPAVAIVQVVLGVGAVVLARWSR